MSRITEALARAKGLPVLTPETTDRLNPWDLDEACEIVPSIPEPEARTPSGAAILRSPFLPDDGEYAEKLFGSSGLDPVVTEQYRRLGAALHQAQAEHGIRALMVTSALPGEGKTLVASNLALVLSSSFGRRVLLVDGDLRRPCLHAVFDVRNSSNSDRRESAGPAAGSAVRLSNTLSLIPAGEPQSDPMRALAAGPIQALLKSAVARHDWVILDTPPVGMLPDAPLLAEGVDRVLLVVRSGSTPYDAAQKAVELIGRERILGIVLNRGETSDVTPYGADYSNYYLVDKKSALMERR